MTQFSYELGVTGRAVARPCPVCAAPGPHPLHAVVTRPNGRRELFRCPSCSLRYFDPMPQTEALDVQSWPDIGQGYRERGVQALVIRVGLVGQQTDMRQRPVGPLELFGQIEVRVDRP